MARKSKPQAEEDGELEGEISREASEDDRADDEALAGEARKKLERDRKLKKKRNDRYRERQRTKGAGERPPSDEAEVDQVLRDDPELAKVYQQFTGKVGTAEDLAALYAMAFAPIGFFVHEGFELHNPDGTPTGECLQLARGTWPCVRKYAPRWLAWLRTHSPEVLALATISFFAGRKAPILFTLAEDPSQLRINRMRAASAAAAATDAARHPQPREGAAAAAQVVEMAREQPAPGKQEAA